MRLLPRLTTRLSHHAWACRLALRLTGVERYLLRRTRGLRSISGLLGVQLCLLSTRGAQTGRRRDVPVIFTRCRDGYLVLGSNGARPHHPQWTSNLLHCERASIVVDGITAPVRARLLTDAERAERWPEALRTWPPYLTYTRRSGRELRMFLLSPE